MTKSTITLLLPVLNEMECVDKILHTLDLNLFDEVLIIDGGSTDGTWQYFMERGFPVVTQLRPGLGYALLDIIPMLNTDYVVEFSLDGNCISEDLPKLVKKIHEGYDLVKMSRYLPPATSQDDTIVTAFGNWMFSKAIRFLGKFPVTDALNIYQGFRRSLLDYPEFSKFDTGLTFDPMIVAVANYRGVKMIELPSSEPARVGGKAKLRIFVNGYCILVMILGMYALKFGLIKLNK